MQPNQLTAPNSLIAPHVMVPKGWGHEEWVCNFVKYCGKFLVFKPLKKCSMHYHVIKDEVLYCDSGQIDVVHYWNDGDEAATTKLKPGMSFHVKPGLRHQMIAGSDGARIIEFSTHHEDSDSIRIIKGD